METEGAILETQRTRLGCERAKLRTPGAIMVTPSAILGTQEPNYVLSLEVSTRHTGVLVALLGTLGAILST